MNLLSKEIVFAAGMLAVPALAAAGSPGGEAASVPDERIPILRNLFLSYNSPLKDFAGEFLKEADKNGLDWRLLPSLAIIETGGRHYQGNNIFGWANGAFRFQTIPHAIELVAKYLTSGAPYRGKSLEDKMRAYNPVLRDYGVHVRRMMARIAPEPAAAPTALVTAPSGTN
jgi:hypothetical protein